jgi:hypothetical protein
MIEDWAKSKVFGFLTQHHLTSQILSFRLGKNGRGAWFKLSNGKMVYRQAPKEYRDGKNHKAGKRQDTERNEENNPQTDPISDSDGQE